jgi:hypothetical protein
MGLTFISTIRLYSRRFTVSGLHLRTNSGSQSSLEVHPSKYLNFYEQAVELVFVTIVNPLIPLEAVFSNLKAVHHDLRLRHTSWKPAQDDSR